jgi:uncharacterized protein YjbJ (UPF0337 family)
VRGFFATARPRVAERPSRSGRLYPILPAAQLSSSPEEDMGFLDKLLGRGKKAAGDITGDASMRQKGAAQERAGAAEDRAGQYEQIAQEQRDQAAQARADQEQS